MEEEKGAGAAARRVPRVLGQNRHETLSRTEASCREEAVLGASFRNRWSVERTSVLPAGTAGHLPQEKMYCPQPDTIKFYFY